MLAERTNANGAAVRRIVILGAGFGGLRLAVALGRRLQHRRDAAVVLVDRSPYHTLRPKLPQAVGGRIPCSVQVPVAAILEGLPVTFLQAEVEGLDPAARRVATSAGPLDYWRLVVALGGEPRVPPGIPGADKGLPCWTFEQACALRRRREFLKQRADELPGWSHDVAVVGGGFVGCELAAELAHALQRHPEPARGRVHVVELARRLLPALPQPAGAAAAEALERAGVALYPGRRVTAIAGGGADLSVQLDDGASLRVGTVVWAAGVRGPRAAETLGLAAGPAGRIPVTPALQWVEDPAVYAMGDSAEPAGAHAFSWEPSAQTAIAHGQLVAANIMAELDGGRLRRYQHGGERYALALGPGRGLLVTAQGPPLAGRTAEWVKEAAILRHLYALGGWRAVRRSFGRVSGHGFRRSLWDRPPLDEGRVFP